MSKHSSTSRSKPRVERAGAPGFYLPGWFVLTPHPDGNLRGRRFGTWTEAMEHAVGAPLVSEATA